MREYTLRVTIKMTVIAQSQSDAEDEAWDNIIDMGKDTEVLSIERF